MLPYFLTLRNPGPKGGTWAPATLAQYIRDNVSQECEVIMTDELAPYPGAVKQAGIPGLKHQTVNHTAGEYVNGDITTNGIESAFSLLKRGIIGSWHKVSAKHLPAYLEEMTFRFNRRNSKTIFLETLQHMITADPLSYEQLTAYIASKPQCRLFILRRIKH
jgi:hypothetical protein